MQSVWNVVFRKDFNKLSSNMKKHVNAHRNDAKKSNLCGKRYGRNIIIFGLSVIKIFQKNSVPFYIFIKENEPLY